VKVLLPLMQTGKTGKTQPIAFLFYRYIPEFDGASGSSPIPAPGRPRFSPRRDLARTSPARHGDCCGTGAMALSWRVSEAGPTAL
jgi:hypothetical protein